MELGNERSSKEEKTIETGSNRGEINGDHSELNVPAGEDKEVDETIEPPKMTEDGNGDEQKRELSPKSTGSSSNSNLGTNSSPGLTKWRRIWRYLNKDASGGVDSSIILKRRLSLNEPSKARDDDNKVKNVGVGELESPAPSSGSLLSVEAVEAVVLDPELVQLVADFGFSVGKDSDNSEDRSSKSLMAASIPKLRHEIGFGREMTRIKNVGGRGGNSLQQRTRRGRGGVVEGSKKIRGNHVMLEKENSQSSVESDLRSSNVGFMRWGSGVNGKHIEMSLNFDLEHGDEAQTGEEVRSGYYKENGVMEDFLRGDLDPYQSEEEKNTKRENFRLPSGIDPFAESIVMLQAAQEALETEIQKIGEICKATETSDLDDQSAAETEVTSSLTLDAHLVELNRKIEHLQYKLDDASATVEAKELSVLELENIIKRSRPPKKEASSTNVPIVEMHDLEFELEGLLKEKIEAEVEYLIITRTARSWKIMVEDQIALLREQKSLAENQSHIMLKLRDTEGKAIRLKEQEGQLEAHRSRLLQTEKVSKLRNKVCKFSFCCSVQLFLLCATFGLFLIQLVPPSEEIVPT